MLTDALADDEADAGHDAGAERVEEDGAQILQRVLEQRGRRAAGDRCGRGGWIGHDRKGVRVDCEWDGWERRSGRGKVERDVRVV